jgi:hypothetical protein
MTAYEQSLTVSALPALEIPETSAPVRRVNVVLKKSEPIRPSPVLSLAKAECLNEKQE